MEGVHGGVHEAGLRDAAKIATAKEQLVVAKENFATSRAELGLPKEPVQLEVSDDEQEKSDRAAGIGSDMNKVLQNFDMLKAQAEAMIHEDKQAAN